MGRGYRYPRRSVPSGQFIVRKGSKEILEAYLGSCVGVVLYDRAACVGGLGHFLLPEPVGMDRQWQAECYAATGLPRFLDALVQEGASIERLEACVAGGALVGPLSEHDLELDIGGRTAEVVEAILRKEGVVVGDEETGGFFTCRLSLNLDTWESRISPLGSKLATGLLKRKPLHKEDLEEALNAVRPIPQIALKIIRMIRQQSYDMEDLAEQTRRDQVISAKVIRLCNSARFGMKTDAIDRALVMVGEKRLLQFILTAALDDFFPESETGYSLCKGGLYKHALGTAMTAESLANFTGLVSGDIAYTAGLLHDIGKVVLDQHISEVTPFFYRRMQVDGMALIDVEHEAFGVSHDEAGGLLAKRWSLPESLTDAIRYHHQPEQSVLNPELTHHVYLADLLMSRFMAGQEMERLDTTSLGPRLERIGIRADQFPVIVDRMPRGMLAESEDRETEERHEQYGPDSLKEGVREQHSGVRPA
jgi:putative nucleotidyltransferase with HDIG domain